MRITILILAALLGISAQSLFAQKIAPLVLEGEDCTTTVYPEHIFKEGNVIYIISQTKFGTSWAEERIKYKKHLWGASKYIITSDSVHIYEFDSGGDISDTQYSTAKHVLRFVKRMPEKGWRGAIGYEPFAYALKVLNDPTLPKMISHGWGYYSAEFEFPRAKKDSTGKRR
jgi:hypothetical protein